MLPASGQVSGAPRTTSVSSYLITMAAKDPEVINIPDKGNNGDDDWQDVGPVNLKEAAAYKEKVDDIFDTMSLMLTDDRKDAIHTTVTVFKKRMAKHWVVMKDADVEEWLIDS